MIPILLRLYRSFRLAALAASCALLVFGCAKDTPIQPSVPQNPPAPAPRVITNTAPTISEVRLSAGQIEAGDQLQATAFVADSETPIEQLTYNWSSSIGGTFTGSGPQVFWRAPGGAQSPGTPTLTLTVTEKYKSNGDIQTNTASKTTTSTLHYNDSPLEMVQLATQFLTDFGTYSMSPSQVVRNFSNSCGGKAAELSDVTNNRKNFQIQSSTFKMSGLGINPTRTEGEVTGPCTFVNKIGSTFTQTVSGTCHMTTIYEKFQWWLCSSDFFPNNPSLASAGSVPGRILVP